MDNYIAKLFKILKGKTTWDGFVRRVEFGDGDVVATNSGEWVGIVAGGTSFDFSVPTYCILTDEGRFYAYPGQDKELWAFNRLATEEEKKKLFDVIEDNGYVCNAEEKRLIPAFKDGDIVSATILSCTWIGIFKQYENDDTFESHCSVNAIGVFRDRCIKRHWLKNTHLASEEEKQELFQAIKDNGYKWNAEKKCLEKLIKPRFKVGDEIVDVLMKDIGAPAQKGVISEITDDMYIFTDGSFMFFDSQDYWELDPDKFDINTLVPFEDKVLVRDEKNEKWMPATWGFYDSLEFIYTVEGGNEFNMCIPYKGNEHLLGTTNDCDKYFKTWEE